MILLIVVQGKYRLYISVCLRCASSWSSVWLWTWPTPSTRERGSRSWLPFRYIQYMNSSLRASILARDSEDHGTVDAQAGVFGEGQSDQWICPINPHHPSLGMGCHISLMLKGKLFAAPLPKSSERARKHEVTQHRLSLPSIPDSLCLKTFVIHVGTSKMQWSNNITTNKLQLFSHGFLWRSVGSCGSPGGRDLCTGGCIGSLHICSATTAQKKSTTRTWGMDVERSVPWTNEASMLCWIEGHVILSANLTWDPEDIQYEHVWVPWSFLFPLYSHKSSFCMVTALLGDTKYDIQDISTPTASGTSLRFLSWLLVDSHLQSHFFFITFR